MPSYGANPITYYCENKLNIFEYILIVAIKDKVSESRTFIIGHFMYKGLSLNIDGNVCSPLHEFI